MHKLDDNYEYQFDPSIDEDAALFFNKAQEAGLNVQTDVIVNPPLDALINVYNEVSKVKGKQESLRGYFDNDGNIYVTYYSVKDVTQYPANFALVNGSNPFVIVYGSTGINSGLKDLFEIYQNNPNLIDNMRNTFGNYELKIGSRNYTIDEIQNQFEQQKKCINNKKINEKIFKLLILKIYNFSL